MPAVPPVPAPLVPDEVSVLVFSAQGTCGTGLPTPRSVAEEGREGWGESQLPVAR